MQLYLYSNGVEVSEIVGIISRNGDELTFSCRPPVLVADIDYDIHPRGGKPMRIMIERLLSDGVQSHIIAVEL